MIEFNKELCDKVHEELSRRVGTVEEQILKLEAKQEERITRIHERFDEVSKLLLTRMPPWVTIVIGVLSATCSGLLVALIR